MPRLVVVLLCLSEAAAFVPLNNNRVFTSPKRKTDVSLQLFEELIENGLLSGTAAPGVSLLTALAVTKSSAKRVKDLKSDLEASEYTLNKKDARAAEAQSGSLSLLATSVLSSAVIMASVLGYSPSNKLPAQQAVYSSSANTDPVKPQEAEELRVSSNADPIFMDEGTTRVEKSKDEPAPMTVSEATESVKSGSVELPTPVSVEAIRNEEVDVVGSPKTEIKPSETKSVDSDAVPLPAIEVNEFQMAAAGAAESQSNTQQPSAMATENGSSEKLDVSDVSSSVSEQAGVGSVQSETKVVEPTVAVESSPVENLDSVDAGNAGGDQVAVVIDGAGTSESQSNTRPNEMIAIATENGSSEKLDVSDVSSSVSEQAGVDSVQSETKVVEPTVAANAESSPVENLGSVDVVNAGGDQVAVVNDGAAAGASESQSNTRPNEMNAMATENGSSEKLDVSDEQAGVDVLGSVQSEAKVVEPTVAAPAESPVESLDSADAANAGGDQVTVVNDGVPSQTIAKADLEPVAEPEVSLSVENLQASAPDTAGPAVSGGSDDAALDASDNGGSAAGDMKLDAVELDVSRMEASSVPEQDLRPGSSQLPEPQDPTPTEGIPLVSNERDESSKEVVAPKVSQTDLATETKQSEPSTDVPTAPLEQSAAVFDSDVETVAESASERLDLADQAKKQLESGPPVFDPFMDQSDEPSPSVTTVLPSKESVAGEADNLANKAQATTPLPSTDNTGNIGQSKEEEVHSMLQKLKPYSEVARSELAERRSTAPEQKEPAKDTKTEVLQMLKATREMASAAEEKLDDSDQIISEAVQSTSWAEDEATKMLRSLQEWSAIAREEIELREKVAAEAIAAMVQTEIDLAKDQAMIMLRGLKDQSEIARQELQAREEVAVQELKAKLEETLAREDLKVYVSGALLSVGVDLALAGAFQKRSGTIFNSGKKLPTPPKTPPTVPATSKGGQPPGWSTTTTSPSDTKPSSAAVGESVNGVSKQKPKQDTNPFSFFGGGAEEKQASSTDKRPFSLFGGQSNERGKETDSVAPRTGEPGDSNQFSFFGGRENERGPKELSKESLSPKAPSEASKPDGNLFRFFGGQANETDDGKAAGSPFSFFGGEKSRRESASDSTSKNETQSSGLFGFFRKDKPSSEDSGNSINSPAASNNEPSQFDKAPSSMSSWSDGQGSSSTTQPVTEPSSKVSEIEDLQATLSSLQKENKKLATKPPPLGIPFFGGLRGESKSPSGSKNTSTDSANATKKKGTGSNGATDASSGSNGQWSPGGTVESTTKTSSTKSKWEPGSSAKPAANNSPFGQWSPGSGGSTQESTDGVDAPTAKKDASSSDSVGGNAMGQWSPGGGNQASSSATSTKKEKWTPNGSSTKPSGGSNAFGQWSPGSGGTAATEGRDGSSASSSKADSSKPKEKRTSSGGNTEPSGGSNPFGQWSPGTGGSASTGGRGESSPSSSKAESSKPKPVKERVEDANGSVGAANAMGQWSPGGANQSSASSTASTPKKKWSPSSGEKTPNKANAFGQWSPGSGSSSSNGIDKQSGGDSSTNVKASKVVPSAGKSDSKAASGRVKAAPKKDDVNGDDSVGTNSMGQWSPGGSSQPASKVESAPKAKWSPGGSSSAPTGNANAFGQWSPGSGSSGVGAGDASTTPKKVVPSASKSDSKAASVGRVEAAPKKDDVNGDDSVGTNSMGQWSPGGSSQPASTVESAPKAKWSPGSSDSAPAGNANAFGQWSPGSGSNGVGAGEASTNIKASPKKVVPSADKSDSKAASVGRVKAAPKKDDVNGDDPVGTNSMGQWSPGGSSQPASTVESAPKAKWSPGGSAPAGNANAFGQWSPGSGGAQSSNKDNEASVGKTENAASTMGQWAPGGAGQPASSSSVSKSSTSDTPGNVNSFGQWNPGSGAANAATSGTKTTSSDSQSSRKPFKAADSFGAPNGSNTDSASQPRRPVQSTEASSKPFARSPQPVAQAQTPKVEPPTRQTEEEFAFRSEDVSTWPSTSKRKTAWVDESIATRTPLNEYADRGSTTQKASWPKPKNKRGTAWPQRPIQQPIDIGPMGTGPRKGGWVADGDSVTLDEATTTQEAEPKKPKGWEFDSKFSRRRRY